MNQANKEIPDLVQQLEHILSLLDKGGYSLSAIKVEEAILALQQLDEQAEDSNSQS